jgi:hypothetical protein
MPCRSREGEDHGFFLDESEGLEVDSIEGWGGGGSADSISIRLEFCTKIRTASSQLLGLATVLARVRYWKKRSSMILVPVQLLHQVDALSNRAHISGRKVGFWRNPYFVGDGRE